MPRAYSPYVGLPRRMAAVLLDTGLALFLVSVVSWVLRLDTASEVETLSDTTFAGLYLLAAPLIIAVFWQLFQGTPGKLLLGCHIVDAHSGGRPRPWQVWLRLLGYVLSAAPAGLGFFWILWDRRRQGWHDKLARTLVVLDDESRKSLEQLRAEYR